jgi:hypothetical protein
MIDEQFFKESIDNLSKRIDVDNSKELFEVSVKIFRKFLELGFECHILPLREWYVTIKFDEFDGYLSLGEHYINGYLRKENSSCVFEYPTC